MRQIADILKDDGKPSGVYRDWTKEQYFGMARMNASTLKAGLVGSKDVDATMIRETFEGNRPPRKQAEQDALDKGTLAHLALLQPADVAGRVQVWEGGVRHGKKWDEFEAEHEGKLIMNRRDVNAVQDACRAFKQVPEVREILAPCDTELTVLTKEGNIYCRAGIDAITREGLCVMLDPKTIGRGIDSHSVANQIRSFAYREQMGIYRRWYTKETGRQIDDVFLIFLSLPPQRIGIRLVRMTQAALEWGEDRMLQALKTLEECIQSDNWPVFFARDVCDVSEWEQGELALTGFDETEEEE